MNSYSATFTDPEAERLLTEHLRAIDERLRRTGAPAEARRQVVEDVRAQVRETAWTRGGADAKAQDVAAVLAEMDPPEAYGTGDAAERFDQERMAEERPRGAGRQRSTRPVWVADFTLLKTLVWVEIGLLVLGVIASGFESGEGRGSRSLGDAITALGLLFMFPALILSYAGLLRRWGWARWVYVGVNVGALFVFLPTLGQRVGPVMAFIDALGTLVSGIVIGLIMTVPEQRLFARAGDEPDECDSARAGRAS